MSRSSKLYNKDLAPTPSSEKKWGWFEIFNVWANDVQSLFGYTLAASLFLASGLNGWAVMLALVLAGFFIMWLVNLSGKPSVKHGIPYPVFARVSMGVFGANFPAMARGIVAMFWYGAQTFAASTAVALLITGLTGIEYTNASWNVRSNVDFIYICISFPSLFVLARNRFSQKVFKLCWSSGLCCDDCFNDCNMGKSWRRFYYQRLEIYFLVEKDRVVLKD